MKRKGLSVDSYTQYTARHAHQFPHRIGRGAFFLKIILYYVESGIDISCTYIFSERVDTLG